jgi:DNA-binding NtrC family response regulator
MNHHRARILVVDSPQGALSDAINEALTRHEVHIALNTADTIYRIDCAARPYDLLFCDLVRGDLSGAELWAFLSMNRKSAARRMVFVASGPLKRETEAFLARVPNVCVERPFDPDALDMLAVRRASCIS